MSKRPSAPADIWEQVDALRTNLEGVHTVPPDSFTVAQYCSKYGVSYDSGASQIKKLFKGGYLSRVKLGREFYYSPTNS